MNKLVIATGLCALLTISGCQTGTEALNVDDVRKSELIAGECAIYFAVEAKLARESRTANGNMSEGCSPQATGQTPEITPNPSPKSLDSRYATILYQRMVARGMPKDIADGVATSKAFHDLVTRSDEVYGRN